MNKIKEGIDTILEQHSLSKNTEIEVKELQVLAHKNSLDDLPTDRPLVKDDFKEVHHTLGKRGYGHAEVYYQGEKIGNIQFPVDKGKSTDYDLADAIGLLSDITNQLNDQGYQIAYNPDEISYRQEILGMAAFHIHGSLPIDGETAKILYKTVMK